MLKHSTKHLKRLIEVHLQLSPTNQITFDFLLISSNYVIWICGQAGFDIKTLSIRKNLLNLAFTYWRRVWVENMKTRVCVLAPLLFTSLIGLSSQLGGARVPPGKVFYSICLIL